MIFILETHRLIQYAEKPYRIHHWRSSHGAEVDLVVESADRLWAIEIKSSPVVKPGSLKGLKSFTVDYSGTTPLCVSTCDAPYMSGELPVIPWKMAFDKERLDLV